MKILKILLLFFNLNLIYSNRKCNNKLIKSYGFVGLKISEKRKSNLCKYAKYNCCTKDDEKNMIEKWKKYKIIYERQYNGYLEMIIYILNLYKFFLKTSEKSKHLKNEFIELKQLNLNEELINEILKILKKQVKSISNLRTESFCLLCNNESYNILFNKDNKINVGEEYDNSVIFLDKNFCKYLIDKAGKGNYFYIKYIIPYLKNISNIIIKKLNIKKSILSKNNEDLEKIIQNCYLVKGKNYFFYCKKLCENFNIMKWSNNFDGNIEEIKLYYDFIKKNISKIDKKILSHNSDLKKSIDKKFNNGIKTWILKKIVYDHDEKPLDQYKVKYVKKNGYYPKIKENNLLKIDIFFKIIMFYKFLVIIIMNN